MITNDNEQKIKFGYYNASDLTIDLDKIRSCMPTILTTDIGNYNNNMPHFVFSGEEKVETGGTISFNPIKIKDVTIEKEKRFVTVVDPTQRDGKGNYKATKTTEEKPKKIIVTFINEDKQYATCNEEDDFDLETGITICICKQLLSMMGSTWFWSHIDNPTKEYNNLVREGIKIYKDKIKAEEQKRLEEEAEKIREAAKQRRRIKRAAKKREREIEIMAEAIRRAKTGDLTPV